MAWSFRGGLSLAEGMAAVIDNTCAGRDQEWVKANWRWNFTTMSLDYGLFGLALSLASASTILPAFAERLGAPNLVIGAIAAIMSIGWQLPGLFAANYTERFPRRLPILLVFTLWERLPFLFMALLAFTVATTRPTLALGLFLLFLAMTSLTSGALNPAWMDLIGKVIPGNYRGRFFGFSSTLGGGLGIGGALLAGYFLQQYAFPFSYGYCFLIAFAFLMVSFGFLAMTREGVLSRPKPAVGVATYLSRLPAILRGNPNYVWYLCARSLAALGTVSVGFYTVFALKVLQVPEVQVAAYTFSLLAAQTAANIAFGFLADHYGHKLVMVASSLAVVLSSLLAIASQTAPDLLYAAFALFGISYAASNVSGLNINLDFCSAEDRPTYVGLTGTVLAPFSVLAPLLGGWMADHGGYELVFWISLFASALGASVLAGMVKDPRQLAVPSEA